MVRKSPVAEEKTPLRDASTSTEAPPPLLARLDKAICDDPLHPFALGRNLRSIIKPAPDQLAVLDGLRAIAVLWVVAVHCCQFVGIEWEWDAGRGGFFWRSGTARQLLWASWPMQVFLQGDLGVDVFFVLSGFLIYRLLALELEASGAIAHGSFLLRRWLRKLVHQSNFSDCWTYWKI